MFRITQKALPCTTLALLLALPVNAETIERTKLMIIQPDQFTTMGISIPFSSKKSEAIRTYSEAFSTSIKFDSKTLKVEGFKFTGGPSGGEILTSAYALTFQDFVTYPSPTGQKSTVVTQAPYNYEIPNGVIRLKPQTVREDDDGEVEFGEVDSEGQLRNLDHRLFADRGAYATWHAIQGVAQNVRVDNYFSLQEPGVELLYKGTSTVEIREFSSTIYEKNVRVFLTIELDETVLSTLLGDLPHRNLEIIETEEGTIVANTSLIKVPTAYGEWGNENGLIKPDPEELNEAGIAYGILFALDLPADATSLPISIENTPSGPVVKIILPESGLNSPMSVEYTTDLTVADWPALPAIYYLDGADSLDLGMTGEPTFGFPAGEIGFIRFATVIE